MTLETIALVAVIGYFGWKLYRAMGKKTSFPADKIRLVSKDTGEVLEMHLIESKPKKVGEWDEEAFILGAKFAFQKVLTAFAGCNLKELKKVLEPAVYQAFEQDILSRQSAKQKMDFSLICFDSVKILQKSPEEVTVRFETEQINLLKDDKNQVIEGDPMTVSTMADTWVFKKVGKEEWTVAATFSQAMPCVK